MWLGRLVVVHADVLPRRLHEAVQHGLGGGGKMAILAVKLRLANLFLVPKETLKNSNATFFSVNSDSASYRKSKTYGKMTGSAD